MPALFTLPKQIPLSSAGLLLPGAKLTFSRTGTSTLQNTYQDILLATPHANPVVADASGVFAPIYLDPSLPNYRVKLTTSADVQVYQVDDFPSNQNAAQTFDLVATAPELVFEETDASSNNKKWRLRAQAEVFSLEILNDAESVATSLLSIGRSGTSSGTVTLLPSTSGSINFLPSASGNLDVLAGGIGLFRYKSREIATSLDGFFTGTFTGFSGATTAQVQYQAIGLPTALGVAGLVILTIPAFTGTSNATTMTMTGIPSYLAATTGQLCHVFVTDNGSNVAGNARIVTSAAQTLTFGVGAAIGGFTGSGTKGFPGEYIQLIYKTAG